VTGLLVLAATPIGDMNDAPPRLIAALASADVVAAEDTRRFRRLVGALGVTVIGEVLSYYEANEVARTPDLVARLIDGATVVLVTDAGTPSVSDPGFRLVAAAVEAGVRVTAIPGPSAVTMALAVSALPVDRFCFEGFLPRKATARLARLTGLRDEERTMVFFEAPHRTEATLQAMAVAFGDDRLGAVCRELTKTYEEVVRGPLNQLCEWANHEVRGEVTLVIAGAAAKPPADVSDAELADLVRDLVADGVDRKAAITDVATRSGRPRREVYDAVVAAKHERPSSD
jgi:16S rRNA (cytidine1402-2'-O)-methyltransferase